MIRVGNETWSDSIFIFTTPADHALHILANRTVPLQCVLYDGSGRKWVRNATDSLEADIDMFVYQPGLYYLPLIRDIPDQTFKGFRKNA